jgi:predicted NAD-dependent protein-ADP-ribosyltransferase YbiA (DUF1768 family)
MQNAGESINPEVIPEVVANEPEIRRVQISAMVRKVGKAVNAAADLVESDPPWLWKLKIKGKSALDEKEVEQAFMEAAKSNSNDDIFQKAVTARESPLNDADIGNEINKVERLLLEQWLAVKNAPFEKSLCYYNDKALAKLIDYLLDFNDGHFNEKSIRNVWKRLGLKKAQPLLFRDIEVKKNPQTNKLWAVPIPYKKLIQT